MLLVDAIQWWYSTGFIRLARRVLSTLKGIWLSFSVPILIMTLFAPWRRIITYGGRTIGDRFRASLDNFISRCVGFCVRVLVLIAAGVLALLTAGGGTAALILWLFGPVIAIGLLVWGFFPW